MAILLTGGAGYIGSHTAVALAAQGFEPVLLDDFSNSSEGIIKRLAKITGKDIRVFKGDAADGNLLDRIFKTCEIDAVIHFAGFKAVGESVKKPLMYYRNNIDTTLSVLEAMQRADVKKIVFSSSATVYGIPEKMPCTEDMPTGAINPYGRTKLMIEQILEDAAAADPELSVMLLRYFNPVGAHESGLMGEDPRDIPNNLMPYISQVAVGRLECLSVFGNDYPTPDGTGVRDYIHVCDLAEGHVAALKYANTHKGALAVNLGTGKGTSVLELVSAFERASGKKIPYKICPRRPGDAAVCYADPKKARELFGWSAKKTVDDMCRDTWNWQSKNPNGMAE